MKLGRTCHTEFYLSMRVEYIAKVQRKRHDEARETTDVLQAALQVLQVLRTLAAIDVASTQTRTDPRAAVCIRQSHVHMHVRKADVSLGPRGSRV